MKKETDKEALKKFNEQRKRILQGTFAPPEPLAIKQARMAKLKLDYNAFVLYYFPHWTDADCADYHLETADNLRRNKIINQFNIIFRGGAKSTHANVFIPLWLMLYHNDLKFLLLVGQNEEKANLLLSDIQAELMENQRIKTDFGDQATHGNWADGQFRCQNGTFFKAIGIDQDARGLRAQQNRPDYISIDDVDSRKLAKNQTLITESVDKITGDIKGAFAKDTQRLVISNNYITKNGILAGLLKDLSKSKRTRITWRNAVDAKGNPTWPQRYTKEYWKEFKDNTPYLSWEREFMNNPVESGKIFTKLRFAQLPDPRTYKQIVAYIDPSWKSTAKSDYKAVAVVGATASQYHILKAFCRQCSVTEMVNWMYDLHDWAEAHGVIISYWMESGLMQDLHLDEFKRVGIERGYQLPIRGDSSAKPDKFMRIEALQPLNDMDALLFNAEEEQSEDMRQAKGQMYAFDRGAKNDDFPDALEGAIVKLRKRIKESHQRPRSFKPQKSNSRRPH